MSLDVNEVLNGVLSQIGFGSSDEAAGTIVKNAEITRQKYSSNETKQTPPIIAPTAFTEDANARLNGLKMKDALVYGGGALLVVFILSMILKKGK